MVSKHRQCALSSWRGRDVGFLTSTEGCRWFMETTLLTRATNDKTLLINGVVSMDTLWPSGDFGGPAPLLRQELGDGTLLLLGIHYLPAIKKEKLLVGRVVLPACKIWMTYASQKKKVMLTLQYFQHSPHITGSTIKKNNCNASSCGTQHVHQ